MNKQELRDEFEKWAMANFNIAPELISDFKYSFTHRLIHAETAFLKGYSLAQETIKAKDAEIERLKSNFAGYENFQREKLQEQNDKLKDMIQAKVMNESFLEAEIEQLKKYKFMYDNLCK